MSVQPVQALEKSLYGSTKKVKKELLLVEYEWIRKLQTPYPLGFNDKIHKMGNISSHPDFNSFSIKPDKKRKLRSHGKRKNKNFKRHNRTTRSLDDILIITKNNGRHELLSALVQLSICNLKTVLDDALILHLRNYD